MKLHQLKSYPAKNKANKRLGRGSSSGVGKTSGKGHKGQKARSGKVRITFEGGQTPLFRRIPKKRGFSNIRFKTKWVVINVESLNKFEDGSLVTPALLKELGYFKQELDGIKILGQGTLTKKLTVQAHHFSSTAKAKIIAAGGKIEVI